MLKRQRFERYLSDADLRLDVVKDVERTHPDMHFFNEAKTLDMLECSKFRTEEVIHTV